MLRFHRNTQYIESRFVTLQRIEFKTAARVGAKRMNAAARALPKFTHEGDTAHASLASYRCQLAIDNVATIARRQSFVVELGNLDIIRPRFGRCTTGTAGQTVWSRHINPPKNVAHFKRK